MGWLSTSEGRRNRKLINGLVFKANAVLRELYRSVVTKRELSNTAKLLVFKSVFVPIFTYGQESLVVTVAIGKPERHMRKASHRGNKQQ